MDLYTIVSFLRSNESKFDEESEYEDKEDYDDDDDDPPLWRLPLEEGDKPRPPPPPLPPLPQQPPPPPPPLKNLVEMQFMLSKITINNVIILLQILSDLQVIWHWIMIPHWVPSVSILLFA
jgi:hypothetical protein